MVSMRDALEEELRELIKVYSNDLTAGEITEAIIGVMTCMACALGQHVDNTLDDIEEDLMEIVGDNVKRARIYYRGFHGIS